MKAARAARGKTAKIRTFRKNSKIRNAWRKNSRIRNAFRKNSTAFRGHRYNAAKTPHEAWACALVVSWRLAAKPRQSFAAIAHPGPMQERDN